MLCSLIVGIIFRVFLAHVNVVSLKVFLVCVTTMVSLDVPCVNVMIDSKLYVTCTYIYMHLANF